MSLTRFIMKLIPIFIISILFSFSASGLIVISNSQDWRDVYSVATYSNLNKLPYYFLVSKKHSNLLLNQIPSGSDVLSISSKNVPQFVGYKSLLQGKGYVAEEIVSDNINLELAKKLGEITRYIVIDDSYGYNALSVAPYAIVSDSYVLFADETNIDDIIDFLNGKKVDHIILYGHLDSDVRDGLAQYNSEIINYDGDRFENNIAIVKKYQEIAAKKQFILTNGEFIEQETISGVEPVLFLGAQNVPDNTRDYIKSAGFEVAVLIGNQYVGSATTIRRSTGVSVFVKFAQGARAPAGPINPVEGLDLFYVPGVSLSLSIFSVKYNQATGLLEITLKNNVEQATYFKGTYTITSGTSSQTVGDVDTLFIDGNELRTMVYPIEPIIESATIDAFVIYGESKNSLERTIEGKYNITIIKVADDSSLLIDKVFYETPKKRFGIVLENNGSVDLFADASILDVKIAGERKTLGLQDVAFIKAGKKKTVYIYQEMTEQDIMDNPIVDIEVRYGQRQEGLIKLLKAKLELKLLEVDYVYYGLISLIVVIIVIIVLTGKKKCKNCGHKNARNRKTCEKCGKDI